MAESILNVDTHHQDMIHDAQLDYYAKRLATCSSDRLIKIYDITTNNNTTGNGEHRHVADLQGHDGPVWEIAWAHPKFGVVLASCSYDGKVIIHREQPPNMEWLHVYVYDKMQSSVNSVAWAPHEYDLCLACASSEGKVSILSHNENDTWTATTFQDCAQGVNAVSWAPYGALGSNVNGRSVKRIVTAGCDNNIRIWGLEEGEREWKETLLPTQHTDWVRDVAWAPSIGLPCNTIASCSEDGKVLIWTQNEGPDAQWKCQCITKFNTPVWRVSWSVTGSVLAVSSGDSNVTLWKESLDREWVQVSDVNESISSNETMIQPQQPVLQQPVLQQQPPQHKQMQQLQPQQPAIQQQLIPGQTYRQQNQPQQPYQQQQQQPSQQNYTQQQPQQQFQSYHQQQQQQQPPRYGQQQQPPPQQQQPPQQFGQQPPHVQAQFQSMQPPQPQQQQYQPPNSYR